MTLKTPISYTEFLRMLKPSDAQLHLYETACNQGVFLSKHVIKPRDFSWWWNHSFSWQDTKDGFTFWKTKGYEYIDFYNCIYSNTNENCITIINNH
jgi:hypothetical protein